MACGGSGDYPQGDGFFLTFRVVAFWSQDNGTALGTSPACRCIAGRKKEQASILDVLSRNH